MYSVQIKVGSINEVLKVSEKQTVGLQAKTCSEKIANLNIAFETSAVAFCKNLVDPWYTFSRDGFS